MACWLQEREGGPRQVAAGVLVVQKVIPGSCAEGHIEPGDVLTRVHSGAKGAGDFASFVSFEELLDDSVRIYCRKPWLPALLRAVVCAGRGRGDSAAGETGRASGGEISQACIYHRILVGLSLRSASVRR